jgi:hypothetical protein
MLQDLSGKLLKAQDPQDLKTVLKIQGASGYRPSWFPASRPQDPSRFLGLDIDSISLQDASRRPKLPQHFNISSPPQDVNTARLQKASRPQHASKTNTSRPSTGILHIPLKRPRYESSSHP